MKNRKSDRLIRIFARWSMLFVIVLSLFITSIGIGIYRTDMYASYYDYADTLTELSETFFDGDDIKSCIESGQMSEKLKEGLDFMNDIKDHSNVAYMYALYYPDENDRNDMRYLLYANTESDRQLGIPDSTIGSKCGDEYTEDIWDAFYKVQFSSYEKDRIGYVVNLYQGVGAPALVMTAYRPVLDSDGKVVCVIGSDIYMSLINRSLIWYVSRVATTAFILMVICIIGLRLIVSRNIIGPVARLADSARRFVKQSEAEDDPEKLEFSPVEIRRDTEIRDLSEDLTAMTDSLKKYMSHLQIVTKEKERIGTELALANKIQTDVLPNIFPAYPERDEFDIYASMNPAKEVGGDFYDFFLVDDDHLCMVMADVSGKGIPAALFMMASKIIIANNAMLGKSPAQILTDTNASICSNNREEMFVTVWLGILEISTGKLTAASAGHEYPAIKQGNGEFVLYKDKHGFVVGGMEGVKYKEYELQLTPGSKIFVYTDGVAEATNAENELFGTERMIEALNRKADAHPEEILGNINDAIDGFVKDAEQFDDLTMLCLEYNGSVKK